jgi:hypothetical protein
VLFHTSTLNNNSSLAIVGVYILLSELLKRPLAILHLLPAGACLARITIATGYNSTLNGLRAFLMRCLRGALGSLLLALLGGKVSL